MTPEMTDLLTQLTAGIAVAILIGAFLMMYTTVWTTKRRK